MTHVCFSLCPFCSMFSFPEVFPLFDVLHLHPKFIEVHVQFSNSALWSPCEFKSAVKDSKGLTWCTWEVYSYLVHQEGHYSGLSPGQFSSVLMYTPFILILCYYLCTGLTWDIFLLGFLIITLFVFLVSSISAECLTNPTPSFLIWLS